MKRIIAITAIGFSLGAPALAETYVVETTREAPVIYVEEVASPGKVQLANQLGVDPANYTVNELARMFFEQSEDGNS
jgi:hypothetical protein